MAEPRLSVPPKKNRTGVMIIGFVMLAVAAGVITYVVYQPSPEPAPPPTPSPPPVRPNTALVDIPVDHPPPAVEDAGTEGDADSAADADLSEEQPVRRVTKRRRLMPEGKIDRRRLQAFIRSKSGQVRQCYERRLKQNNLLSGVLVPQIRIHPTGSVRNVAFSQDTLHDGQVRNCVSRVIRGWRFPQPEGGAVTVAYPYRFEPRQ